MTAFSARARARAIFSHAIMSFYQVQVRGALPRDPFPRLFLLSILTPFRIFHSVNRSTTLVTPLFSLPGSYIRPQPIRL